jgi:hypothetical protein
MKGFSTNFNWVAGLCEEVSSLTTWEGTHCSHGGEIFCVRK